jgi:hypothetical protein
MNVKTKIEKLGKRLGHTSEAFYKSYTSSYRINSTWLDSKIDDLQLHQLGLEYDKEMQASSKFSRLGLRGSKVEYLSGFFFDGSFTQSI